MAETTKPTKATAEIIDFSNVKDQSGFNRKRIPAGDYAAIITKVENATAKDDTKQYLFSIKVKDRPSSVFAYYCKLQENQLWKLRNLLIAAGKTVPKTKSKVDPNQVVGKLIGITVEDDDYDGKEQSQITGVFPASELGDSTSVAPSDDEDDNEAPDDDEDLDDLDNGQTDDEPEEEPEPEEAEEEEEAEEADPYVDLTRDELKRRIKAIDAAYKVFKTTTDDTLRAALAKLESGVDNTPAPAAKAAPKARAPKPNVADISDDDLDDINIDDL